LTPLLSYCVNLLISWLSTFQILIKTPQIFRVAPNSYLLGCLWTVEWGTQWSSWLRHCAISRKDAGSIPDSVIGIFHWYNPSGLTMNMGSTQSLKEMSTTIISLGGGGSGRCVGLTTVPPSCVDCLEIWEPPGTLRACPSLECDCFFFTQSNSPARDLIVKLCNISPSVLVESW